MYYEKFFNIKKIAVTIRILNKKIKKVFGWIKDDLAVILISRIVNY